MWSKINQMPGLNQLRKFAQDIDALGNEANRRIEKSETLPVVELPTNISEADDSEEFLFGLPEQNNTNASENIDTDSSLDADADSSNAADVDALLSSFANNNSQENISSSNSDFSIPGLDDNLDLSALDSFDSTSIDNLSNEGSPQEISNDFGSLLDDESFDLASDSGKLEELDFSVPDLEDVPEVPELEEIPEVEALDSLENLGGEEIDFSVPDLENIPEEPASENQAFGGSDFGSDVMDFSVPDLETPPDLEASDDLSVSGLESLDVPNAVEASDLGEDFSAPDFDAGSFDIGDLGGEELDFTSPEIETPPDFSANADFSTDDLAGGLSDSGDDFSAPDFDAGSFDMGSLGGEELDFTAPEIETPPDFSANADFSTDDLAGGVGDSGDDFSTPDFDVANFDTSNIPQEEVDFSVPDFDQSAVSEESSPLGETDFSTPDFDISSFDTDSLDFDAGDAGGDEFSAPQFDTSSIPLDIPLSDVDMGVGGDDGFENASGSDDFESSFSDFDLVPPEVPQETKRKSVTFGSGKGKKEEVLSTELTDEQYKTFLQNLSYYPLNLRLALEEMIVGNEFNDDVIMEVIHKVIKRIPARQLATQVEKLMDRSIPVPMNYEKRTVAEYEIYRQSLEYKLKNKILPYTLAGIVVVSFCILLGFLTAKFVVRPVKANILYKEGYTLVENGLYPQSESKFNEAVSYKSVKKWHFKYARAYVENNQYERAGAMYERLLHNFNYDLAAGLEYATMELEERSNYEKAESITRRFVLDHHINSEEGILLLGDIFLEWATNRDPAKFEDARVQYANLIQLYGQQPLYLSRMMRYFIRTDNLEEVLQLKEYFYPKLKKDILEPCDLVELSGYMLDKFYGELPAKDEYLRSAIEDLRELLEFAVDKATDIPESLYNYGRYFIETNSYANAESVLEKALAKFADTPKKTQNRLIAEIDTYRLLGELSAEDLDYLKAENYFADGLTLFENERDNSNLRSDKKVGLLYEDLADLDYFISGNFDASLANYVNAVENYNDTPSIRYKIGYIQYSNENFAEALGSFIKAVNDKPSDKNLLLALGNTLTLRNSMSAAQGYYEKLIGLLDLERNQSGVLRPQTNVVDGDLVELYMKAANNLGVVLSLRAEQTGNGNLLPKAMANYEESIRAFDALTRNQETMIRVPGSNLAAFNQKYLTYTHTDFTPSIYTELSPVMEGEKIPEKALVK